MADADVPISVDDALVGQDAARRHQILDDSGKRRVRRGGLSSSRRHSREHEDDQGGHSRDDPVTGTHGSFLPTTF